MRCSPSARVALLSLVALILTACSDVASNPEALALTAPTAPSADRRDDERNAAVRLVRQLAASRGVVALPRRQHIRPELVKLGQALAFDPILSGRRNISCMTCHMPAFGTSDGKNLSIGEGGNGFGPARSHPQGTFIPRNAPPLFNMAAMKHLFWDGRVEMDGHGRVSTPAGAQVTPAMQRVFEFGPISAIGMFPVTSRVEMRGLTGSELAGIPDSDNPAIWRALMNRLLGNDEYRHMFEDAYPGTRLSTMTFANASNAIGAFIVDRFTFDDTPWDRFLAGDSRALTKEQLDGAQTFLTLKCSVCHTGATFSDEQFHDVAVPQLGPGEGDGGSTRDDFGRMRVTGLTSDRYRFRTTPLRNVEFTAPYGHDGAVASLRGFIEHYSDSDVKLFDYDASQLDGALRSTVLSNTAAILAQRDTLLTSVVLTNDIVTQLTNYMSALTDESIKHIDKTVPKRVPSGLPVIPRRM